MSKVIIYTTEICPYCVKAKQLLARKNISFEEIRVDKDSEKMNEMIRLSNRYTVPQIFINGQPIGGYNELYALDVQGHLEKLCV